MNSTNVRDVPMPVSALRAMAAVAPRSAGWLSAFLFTRPRRHPRPAWEAERLAGARPLGLAQGVRAWVWGDAGPWVLLVHGWEGRGSQLAAFVAPLQAAGLRVIAFDARAHGDSAGRHTHIRRWLDPINDLRARFGQPLAVIAHSFGCPATTLALRHGLAPATAVYLAPPDALDVGTRTFAEWLGLGELGRQALRGHMQWTTGLSFADQRIAVIGQRMQTPLLVIHDEGDRDVSPACARTYVRHWPDCRVVTTRGLGHRKMLRDPRVIELAAHHITQALRTLPPLDRWLVTAEAAEA